MKSCETCLWACCDGIDEEFFDSEDCEFYYPINEDETLEIEHIEELRINFADEWNAYVCGWN